VFGADVRRRGGWPISNFLYRWLSSDAAMFVALFVLLCLLLVYFYFALSFEYFD
jgi:hypothetical protein